jgi:molybdate transport system substrate-binding protein
MKSKILLGIFILVVGLVGLYYLIPQQITKTRVAVAANFLGPMTKLVKVFENHNTAYKVQVETDSTGKLYTRIKNGEPFDLFLAADTQRTKQLEQESLAVPGSYFVYAIGTLVLWSNQRDLIDAKGEVLNTDKFKHLAIAPVADAPYGKAAQQTLEKLGLWQKLWPRIIQSVGLTHAYQLIVEGQAELGFLAQSQLVESKDQGSRWIVPQNLYDPLEQSAILLKMGQNNSVAIAFIDFLHGAEAHSMIKEFGYTVP